MIHMKTLLLISTLAVLAGCSSNSDRSSKVASALGQAQVSLGEVVTRAETAEKDQHLTATRATLVTSGTPLFKVALAGNGVSRDVDVDLAGKIIKSSSASTSAVACPGATTARDALAIAEKEAGGKAVQIQPDDDDACLYEVQALNGSTLWEVKIDRNGSVLEKEDVTNDTEED